MYPSRLAGYVSKAAPGRDGDLEAGTYLQEQMEMLDREDLPQSSRRSSRGVSPFGTSSGLAD